MDVRVVLQLVWGNTKNIINSFCTFYKSSLNKAALFFIEGSEDSLHPFQNMKLISQLYIFAFITYNKSVDERREDYEYT